MVIPAGKKRSIFWLILISWGLEMVSDFVHTHKNVTWIAWGRPIFGRWRSSFSGEEGGIRYHLCDPLNTWVTPQKTMIFWHCRNVLKNLDAQPGFTPTPTANQWLRIQNNLARRAYDKPWGRGPSFIWRFSWFGWELNRFISIFAEMRKALDSWDGV